MDDVFSAIADPARRALLEALSERDDQTLFELCVRLQDGDRFVMSRQAVSKHLAVLEGAGLIRIVPKGRYRLHSIDAAPLASEVAAWIDRISTNQRKDTP